MTKKLTSLLISVLLAICCMTLWAENLPRNGSGIETDPYKINSAVNLQNISNEPTATPDSYTIAEGTTTNSYVTIYGNCDAAQQLRSTCPQPINVTVDGISAYAATLNWERGELGAETAWNVQYYATADPSATQTVTVNDLNQYVLLGLTVNTEYACRVQAFCSATDQSEWTAPITFTTGPVPSDCATIADGTATNEYVPVYGYYCDSKQRSQSIYPASMLTALAGRTITSLKYFVSEGSSANWSEGEFTVSMAMTAQENLTTAWATDATTTVYTGTLTATVADGMTITLDAPFTYTGGNLLVSFELPVAAGWTHCYFYGITSTGGSRYIYGDNYDTEPGTLQDFLPKVQFCVEASGCSKVTNLTAVGITNNTAHVQWYPANTTDTEWRFSYADHAMDSAAAAAAGVTLTTPSYDLTGLEVDVTYFVYVQTSCGEGVYSDWAEYQFTTRPLCSQPSVVVSDITDNSATLTCSNVSGTADSYSYKYWPMGSTDTISFDGAAAVTLGGNNVAEDVPLQPMTWYGYRVKTNCTGSDGCSRWTEGTFKTACNLPFNEGFEADSWTLDCWTTADADGDGHVWEVRSPLNGGNPHSGSQVMSSASYDANADALTPDNWLISPAITITDNQQLSWWIGANPNYPNKHYAVYIISGTDLADTTNIYETTLTTDAYVQQVVKLRERAGQTIKVAFRHFDCTNKYLINLDDVVIEDIPPCAPPFGMVTNYALSNSVNVSWQQGKIETAWEYVVADSALTLPSSFDSYTPTPVSERENITISGLTAENEYWLYVRSACGGTNGSWSAPLTFVTLCAQETITVESDISSSEGCWQNQILENEANDFIQHLAISNGSIIMNNSSATIGAKTRAVSMPIWTKDSTNVQLSFRMKHKPNPAFTEKGVTIQYSYNTKDWVSIDTLTHHADRAAIMEHVYINPAFDNQENLFIGFLFENDGSGDETAIHAPFVVGVAPNCAKPLNLFADNVTNSSANMHWSGDLGAATYNIAVLENSTTRPDTAIIHHGVAATGTYNFTLTSLTGSTDYHVYVQAVYGGTDSSAWSQEAVFTTKCDAAVIDEENPYTEDFNSYASGPGNFPDCWSFLNLSEYAYTYPQVYVYANPTYAVRGNCLYFKSSSTTPAYAALPKITGDIETMVLSFWYKNEGVGEDNGTLSVGVMTDPGDASTYTQLQELAQTTNGTEVLINFSTSPVSGGDYYIAFKYTGGTSDNYYLGVDNVQVRLASTSTEIADYTAVTEQGTAITEIDADNHQINVQLKYGYEAGTDITPTITLAFAEATVEPASGTAFQWWHPSTAADTTVNYTVTAESGATQLWAAHFLTESCPSPDNLTAIQTAADNINFAWSCLSGPTEWHFYLSETPMTQAALNALTASDYTAVTATNTTVASFNGETQYYYYVRTACSESEYSGWKAGTPFTTWENCVAPTNLAALVNDDDVQLTWTNPTNLPTTFFTDDMERATVDGGIFTYTNGSLPWTIVPNESHSSSSSLKSASGNDSQTSTISMTYTLTAPDTISFWYKVSSEPDCDWFNFNINGTQELQETGEATWTKFTKALEAGTYTFSWNYSKDGSVAIGSDCVWIDDITLPATPSEIVILRDGLSIDTTSATLNSYVDADLALGDYCYSLKTLCRLNNESVVSSEVCAAVTGCISPISLAVSDVTDNSATISWVRGNNETAWNIELNGTAYPQVAGVTVDDDTLIYSLTGLTSNTDYSVRVQSYCSADDNSAWSSMVNFTTEVMPVTTPYSQDFETDLENNQWRFDNGTQTNQWFIGAASHNGGTKGLYISNDNGVTNTYNTNSSSTVFAKRNINLTAADYTIEFDWKGNGESTYDFLRVYFVPESEVLTAGTVPTGLTYNTTPAGWIALDGGEKLSEVSTWQHRTQEFTIPADGNYNLVLYWENDGDSGTPPSASVDNIRIYACAETNWLAPVVVCGNEGYTENGFNLSGEDILEGTNEYFKHETAFSASGCDSTTAVEITKGIEYQTPTAISFAACGSSSYTFYNGNGTVDTVVTTAGIYERTLQTALGCDSVVTLNFTINYSNTGDTTAVACNSFTWYGTEYTSTPAIAPTHTLTNVAGCDSTVTLHLTINEGETNEITAAACYSYTWNDETYDESGDYVQTFQNTLGCDSTVTLHLTINSETNEFATAACYSYTWNDQTYTTSGDYVQTFQNTHGCDSTVTLHLTINEGATNEITAAACYSYTWNDETYDESGDYVQTFQNTHGCDSTVTLHLTINEGETNEFAVAACYSYTWNDETYDESGDYVQTFQNTLGCDSTVTLHLTINEGETNEITATACGSYTWNNETYDESGDYVQTFQNTHGCDSTVTLHLTINEGETNEFEFTASACESYTWNDQTYTTSGDYVQEFQNTHGCDSVVTLHLTINSATNEFAVAACYSYTWNNETYDESGDYVQTFQNTHGCDSTVTLHLTINEGETNEITAAACDSYTWNDETYDESGDYVQTFQNTLGCDSVVTLHLTINSETYEFAATACDEYIWNDETYGESGDYVQTFQNTLGCDSVVTLHLTVNPLPIITISGDTLIEQNESVTLTASGAETYLWSTNETTPSIVVTPQTTTLYSVIGTDANGCEGYAEIQISITVDIEDVEFSNMPSLQMFPNPAYAQITLQTTENTAITNVEIYDVLGKLIETVVTQNTESSQSRIINVSSLLTGTYFVHVTFDGNKTVTKKLMIAR